MSGDISDRRTNLGRPFSTLLDDTTPADLTAVAEAIWASVHSHPRDASCECPAIEALAVLYVRGYKLVKQP